jgi:hypothetical protein
MSGSEYKMVKVRFAKGETGWGRQLEPGRVMIANIPLTDRLNIDDLVEVDTTPKTGPLEIARVLKRTFECKTAIEYPTPHLDNYAKLLDAWNDAGIKCEGMLPGLAIVAHHENQDPVRVATDAGVTVTLHEAQPELEPVPDA